jgi:hypothetical protein
MILEISGKSHENYIDVVENGFDLQDAAVTGHSPG